MISLQQEVKEKEFLQTKVQQLEDQINEQLWLDQERERLAVFRAEVEMLEEMDSKRRLLQNQLELKERQDVLALLEEEAAFELEQERSRREAAEAKVSAEAARRAEAEEKLRELKRRHMRDEEERHFLAELEQAQRHVYDPLLADAAAGGYDAVAKKIQAAAREAIARRRAEEAARQAAAAAPAKRDPAERRRSKLRRKFEKQLVTG